MVATVAVFFDHGGSDNNPGTQQDVSGIGPPNLRFKTADDASIDANNPIPSPDSGDNYSFWKQIYLKVTGGDFTQIDNVKFYADGAGFGTGITAYIGDQQPVKNSGSNSGYDVATGTVGTTGLTMISSHSGITSQTDAFTYTVLAPKDISISESDNMITEVNQTTNYLVCQLQVSHLSSPGDLPDETWTYQYDEI